MPRFIKSKVIAALIVVSAALVPVAQAMPIDPPTASKTVVSAPVVSPQVQHELGSSLTTDASAGVRGGAPSSGTSSDGFSWGDAAVGAAGMLALIGLGTGAALGLGRSRARRSRPATAS